MIKIKSKDGNVSITTQQTGYNNLKIEMMSIFRSVVSYTRTYMPDMLDNFVKYFCNEVYEKKENTPHDLIRLMETIKNEKDNK